MNVCFFNDLDQGICRPGLNRNRLVILFENHAERRLATGQIKVVITVSLVDLRGWFKDLEQDLCAVVFVALEYVSEIRSVRVALRAQFVALDAGELGKQLSPRCGVGERLWLGKIGGKVSRFPLGQLGLLVLRMRLNVFVEVLYDFHRP